MKQLAIYEAQQVSSYKERNPHGTPRHLQLGIHVSYTQGFMSGLQIDAPEGCPATEYEMGLEFLKQLWYTEKGKAEIDAPEIWAQQDRAIREGVLLLKTRLADVK